VRIVFWILCCCQELSHYVLFTLISHRMSANFMESHTLVANSTLPPVAFIHLFICYQFIHSTFRHVL